MALGPTQDSYSIGTRGSCPKDRAGQNIKLTTNLHLLVSGATPLSSMSFCGMHSNNIVYNSAVTKFVTM